MLQLLKRLRQFQYTTLRTGQEDYMVRKELYLACIGTKQVWKDKEETVNKVAEVEYWLNCSNMGVTHSKKKTWNHEGQRKIPTHALFQNKHSVLHCFLLCLKLLCGNSHCPGEAVSTPHVSWLGKDLTPSENYPSNSTDVHTAWTANLMAGLFTKFGAIFNHSAVYLCVHFLQSTFPARQSATLAGFQ